MANDSYTVASGARMDVGRARPSASRPWAAAVPANDWTVVGAQTFSAWAATGIPYSNASYNGNGSAKEAIINAYDNPAIAENAQYFYGGGHGDGSCNAVAKLDKETMAFSLVGQPTNPAKYPPSYYNGGSAQPGALTYPSGATGSQFGNSSGYFLPAPPLTDAADLPYATNLARSSTHMYAASAMRGSVMHCFYLTYGEFDTATGLWLDAARGVDIGAQLYANFPNYNSTPLQQGTVAVYDEVTDRFFVTLNPGDGGGAWRNRVMVWNPNTRAIDAICNPGTLGVIGNSVQMTRVGRKLYLFLKTSASGTVAMNTGLILDMDARTFSKFLISGDPARTKFADVSGQETIPHWYDGAKIRRWNHGSPSSNANRGYICSVNLTPISGSGTDVDPYVLQQTETAVANAPAPAYVYRLDYDAASGCVVLLPSATLAARALRFQE